MKLLSLFKFRGKNSDIDLLLESILGDVKSNLFNELKDKKYYWYKSDSVKKYQCFLFSRFLLDYSFSVVFKDLDKSMLDAFKQKSESVFIQMHDKDYSDIFMYSDLKSTIQENYNMLKALRSENKAPLCWHMIYAMLTDKKMINDIESDIGALKKAVFLLSKKSGADDLILDFNNRINQKINAVESFDLAEISFRTNIRFIKKQLKSANIHKQLSTKK